MIEDLEFFERIANEKKYKDYITQHIEGVESAYHRLIEPLRGKYSVDVDDAVNLCGQLVPLHDLSKLSKAEFDPYRVHFNPIESEKGIDDSEEWSKAKQHHYSVNPHHPAYWNRSDGKQDMPLEYIFEMLCDWSSMSRWHDSSVIDFYDNAADKEKAAFTDNTRKQVDFWVDEIFRKSGIDW